MSGWTWKLEQQSKSVIYKVKLKNAEDMVLIDDYVYEWLTTDLYLNKIEFINNRFAYDQHRLAKKQLKQEQFENGLNERRDEMLKTMIAKRDEQLNQVNDFVQEMEPNQQNNLEQKM